MELKLGQYDKDIVRKFMNLEPIQKIEHYTIEKFEQLGKEILVTILDYYRINPYTRINNTKYKSYDVNY